MYSSDNNNLHDHKIEAKQILELIESLGDDQLTAFLNKWIILKRINNIRRIPK